MKVARVEVIPLAPDAGQALTAPFFAVLRVHADGGAVGIGRAYARSRAIIDQVLAPLLIGEDPLNHERTWAKMYAEAGRLEAEPRTTIAAIGALDIALWDLAGKILGCPVHRLLGGYRDEIPAYADGGMFARGPEGHAAWAEQQVAAGYRAVKYHVMGEPPDEIVATVRRCREAIGWDVKLMVDVHKLWDPWVGIETARRLEEYDVFWIEEPILWDDQVRGLAIVAAGTRISIAAGESEHTVAACRDLIERGGIKVLQTDILVGGGYTAWRVMAALARAHHVKVAPHGASFPELAAPLQAAVPNGLYVSAFPRGEPVEIWSRLYRQGLDLRDGTIYLSDRPGLGLELDEDYVASRRA